MSDILTQRATCIIWANVYIHILRLQMCMARLRESAPILLFGAVFVPLCSFNQSNARTMRGTITTKTYKMNCRTERSGSGRGAYDMRPYDPLGWVLCCDLLTCLLRSTPSRASQASGFERAERSRAVERGTLGQASPVPCTL